MGRTWKFDKKAIHNGLTNEITFTHGSKKLKLVPLTPSKVVGDQVQIKLKWDEENNRKRKEKQPLMVDEKCKEVSVSSKRLAKKVRENHTCMCVLPMEMAKLMLDTLIPLAKPMLDVHAWPWCYRMMIWDE